MNNFQKQWVGATCAPESIVSIKSGEKGFLDMVFNEERTNKVLVLSDNKGVVSVGRTYNEILVYNPMSFIEGAAKVAELLGPLCYKL